MRDAFFAARRSLKPGGGELTGAALQWLACGRRAGKAFLPGQRHVAGVGNNYADEALFCARILDEEDSTAADVMSELLNVVM